MKIALKIFTLIFIAGLIAAGCKYDWIIPEEIPVIDTDDPELVISFSKEIIPVFTGSNNCIACHNGSLSPDLRAENAYSSLSSSRYVNKDNPEESRIYTTPHPDGSHYKKITAGQAALILAWIKQGAKNN